MTLATTPRRATRRGLLALWYAAVAVVTLSVLTLRPPDPDGVLIFERLDFSPIAESEADPAMADQWRSVSLPDNWRDFPDRQSRAGVYRGRFALPDPPVAVWSVQIPTFSSGLRVFVNGAAIDESLPYGASPPLDQPLPFLARIPAHLLRAGDNQIAIRIGAGGLTYGFLDRVFVGPDAALRPNYQMRWFLTVTVPHWLIAWELILAIAMLVLWIARPSERAYALFCGLLAWAIISGLPLVFYDQPLSQAFWGRLGYVADIWQACLAVPFAYHFVGRRPPAGISQLLLIPGVVTLLSLIASTDGFSLVVYAIILPFGLSFLLWCWAVLAGSAFRHGHVGAHFVTASLICVVMFTIHDTLIVYNIIGTQPFYLLRYSFLLVLTVISGALVHRFIRSLNEVDHLIRSLQTRISEKERELAQSFARQRAIERRRDLNDERTRLMRDMHDGLGGQLVSVVSMAEHGGSTPQHMAAVARSALDDLRLVIASLDIDEDDLPALLGTFRERAERQLAAHGLALEWRMSELATSVGLGPSSALQILRILQEAVTNIVKHAQARTVQISVSERGSGVERAVEIGVMDDGLGGIAQRAGGAGVANMKARAASIGAHLDIDSSARGSSVRLCIPGHLPPCSG